MKTFFGEIRGSMCGFLPDIEMCVCVLMHGTWVPMSLKLKPALKFMFLGGIFSTDDD